METDRNYFFEGLFIIGLAVAAAFFAVWVSGSSRSDDVLYRIDFPDSVSGLSVGDPVKFRGVDVGTVESMIIAPEDARLVRVHVSLRRDTPVKTDTRASLALKGLTGVVFIELNGGDPAAKTLLAVTPQDKVPEIPSEKAMQNTQRYCRFKPRRAGLNVLRFGSAPLQFHRSDGQ